MTDFVQDVVNDQFSVKTGDGATVNDSLRAKFAEDWKLTEKADHDALDVRVTTNEADIATNEADIATNGVNIATNTSDIATNASDIVANTAAIATKGNFFTGTTALLALQQIGLDDTAFASKTWTQSAVIIKDAMIALGGGILFFGFDTTSTVPNLTAAINAAGGETNQSTVFEAATSTSTTNYPVLACKLYSSENLIQVSNVMPFISGTTNFKFKSISLGEDVDEQDCTAVASFSSFSVKAVKRGGVTSVYGIFKLSADFAGHLFTIPAIFGTPNADIGCVCFTDSINILSISLVNGTSQVYTGSGVLGDVSTGFAYVNLTYSS